jgi:hypothetical protein
LSRIVKVMILRGGFLLQDERTHARCGPSATVADSSVEEFLSQSESAWGALVAPHTPVGFVDGWLVELGGVLERAEAE